MTKVNVQTLASESFSDGTIANYPKYIKGLDKTDAEKLAMTFVYAGNGLGKNNGGYLDDVGGSTSSASFAFRIFRSDEREMQFSNGGPGVEFLDGAVTMGLKFSSTKTDRPTVRLYRSMRNASSSIPGSYSFQGNGYANSPNRNYVPKVQQPASGAPYVQFFGSSEPNGSGDRAPFFLYEYFGKEAVFLYNAITEAASYLQKVESVDPNSANTKALIAAFNSAVSTYKKYNVLPMPNDADPRGDMTKAAEILISFYSFIDIPVEILDFRSDLFMMEFDNVYFSLVHDYNTKPEYFNTAGEN
jgi:hypothetical protein